MLLVTVRASIQHCPHTPPIEPSAACPTPRSAEIEKAYEPDLPRAEAASNTGNPNTPFDSVHGIRIID